jgi:O-antigen/teichoic acid export membrane protein
MSQLGIYGACYKISIVMSIFIQAFRYAAEPFFFSYEKESDSRKIYADVMNYFVIIVSLIFLTVMLYIDIVMLFVGENFRFGQPVVPILLMANLCLGIFYNLSIWYKLTNRTGYGALLSIFGAIITLALNFYWIPRIGYMGSAWATFICYASMMVLSYVWGQKYYHIKYNLKRIFSYLGLALAFYFISYFFHLDNIIFRFIFNTFLLLLFIVLVLFIEKPPFIFNLHKKISG